MRLVLDGRGEGRIFAKLVGRLYAETSERLFHMIKRHFAPVSMRFLNSLQKACPHLSKEEVFWRFHCVAGTMAHTLAHWDHLEIVSVRPIKQKNIDAVMAELVRFLAAGFRALRPGASVKRQEEGETQMKKIIGLLIFVALIVAASAITDAAGPSELTNGIVTTRMSWSARRFQARSRNFSSRREIPSHEIN
jgi:hypothetical protein